MLPPVIQVEGGHVLQHVVQAQGGVIHHLQGVRVVLAREVSHAPAPTYTDIITMKLKYLKGFIPAMRRGISFLGSAGLTYGKGYRLQSRHIIV